MKKMIELTSAELVLTAGGSRYCKQCVCFSEIPGFKHKHRRTPYLVMLAKEYRGSGLLLVGHMHNEVYCEIQCNYLGYYQSDCLGKDDREADSSCGEHDFKILE